MFRPIIASRRLDSGINDEDNIQFDNNDIQFEINDIQFKYPEKGFDWRYVLGELGLPPWFLKS